MNIFEKCCSRKKGMRLLPCQARGEAPAFPPLSVTGKAMFGQMSSFFSMENRHAPTTAFAPCASARSPAGRMGYWTGFNWQDVPAGDSKLLPSSSASPTDAHGRFPLAPAAPSDTEHSTVSTGHWTPYTGHWTLGTAPASAGQSRTATPMRGPLRAHPRARGDVGISVGLSPESPHQ